jgi:hypothetical protein
VAFLVSAFAILPAVAVDQAHRTHHTHAHATHATATKPHAHAQAPAASSQAGGKHEARVLTPDQMGHDGFVTGVAEAPLRDLNVMNGKIPPVLKLAMEDPYGRPNPYSCREITTQVRSLYEALGPDYDERTLNEHSQVVSKNTALDAMRVGERAYIPFDGVIRFVSGADRHDRYVLAAIQAGATRRAYLKGLGEAHGCGTPGAPDHLAHAGAARREPGFGSYPKASQASSKPRT